MKPYPPESFTPKDLERQSAEVELNQWSWEVRDRLSQEAPRRKEVKYSMQAAEFARDALGFLEGISGQRNEQEKAKVKLAALMGFFESGALQRIYPEPGSEEEMRAIQSRVLTGAVFEGLGKFDRSVAFNRLGWSVVPIGEKGGSKRVLKRYPTRRDLETEQLVLELLQSDEPLLPVGFERNPENLPPDLWTEVERHFQYRPERRGVTNPDDLAIRSMRGHPNWGLVYGMAEYKLSANLLVESADQLENFHEALQREITGRGTSREASLNQVLPTLREEFGLHVADRLLLAEKEEMEKHLILPADQDPPAEILVGGRFKGWKIDHSVFTQAEIYALALKFIPRYLSLPERFIIGEEGEVKLREVEVRLAGPEKRDGLLIPFEAANLERNFVDFLKTVELEVVVPPHGFLQARYHDVDLEGDQLVGGQVLRTYININTPLRPSAAEKDDPERLKRMLFDFLGSYREKNIPLVTALYHNLEPERGGPPNRSLNLYFGRGAAESAARRSSIKVDFECEPRVVSVDDGKLHLGDYEWGKVAESKKEKEEGKEEE